MPRKISEQLLPPEAHINSPQNESDDPSELKLSIFEDNQSNENNLPSQLNDLTEQSYIIWITTINCLENIFTYNEEENKAYDHKYGVRWNTDTEKLMTHDWILTVLT